MARRQRTEHDSLGAVQVPADALYGPQTQRALDIGQLSGWRFPRPFIRALGLVKRCAADANLACGRLEASLAAHIGDAALAVERGDHDDQFPLDVFQTGSGTSTNMNANEVIARLASRAAGAPVHPNDHVNLSQSSNDVIPTVIHVSTSMELTGGLLPALDHLAEVIGEKAETLDDVVVTGRTHLMDAVPLRLSQALGGWRRQITRDAEALRSTLPRLAELAVGGTAVGTGLNAPPAFGEFVVTRLAAATQLPFVVGTDRFALISSQDTAVEVSGQLRTCAVSLMKIANDLRWMGSGPTAGLGEITLPALQPGSSIMPGKVNPVVPEAVAMACAQVVGHDVTITLAGQAGAFQLNTMLPVIAHDLLLSLRLLDRAARILADRAIAGFTVDREGIAARLGRNAMLVTALTPRIGYAAGATIVQRAQKERRSIREVAAEVTGLGEAELDRLLDPAALTRGGIPGDDA